MLHPEKYLAGELPAEIEQPTPPAGATGDIVHDVVGELGMRLILRETIDAERALAAAGGWNGDRILVAEAGDGSRRWIIWVTRWDSEVDAEEFHDALADALVARFGEAGLEWREADGGRAAEFPGQVIQLTRPDVDAVRLEVEIEWTGPAAESGA